MKFAISLLVVLSLFFNINLESSNKSAQKDKFIVNLSKKELDLNTTYFFCDDLFSGKKFTIKGFKVKFSGRPLIISNEIAFGNNLKYILKRQEVGSKVLIYDIESFMIENEKAVHQPKSNKVVLEVTFTE